MGRAGLPIPGWLFSWAAAIVLIVSFVALSAMWRVPRLQHEQLLGCVAIPRTVPVLVSTAGLALFALVLYSGFAGAQVPGANFSVTFIYVAFWIGMPLLSVIAGDVFPVLSPWRSLTRCLIWAARTLTGGARKLPLMRYPTRLGVWPAVVCLISFGWLELVYTNRDLPSIVATLSLGYCLAMIVGMLVFGIELWESRADGFSVYFSLLSRLSMVKYRGGMAYLRRPLSGLADLPVIPGTVALICATIGVTTFDGMSNGVLWRKAAPGLESVFSAAGISGTAAIELTYTVGLLLCIGLVAGVFRAVAGEQGVGLRRDTREAHPPRAARPLRSLPPLRGAGVGAGA